MNELNNLVKQWGKIPALSIQQPWAWLILHAGKDVENRTWPTKYRGKFFIHAAKKFDRYGYGEILRYSSLYLPNDIPFPTSPNQFPRGGIVGLAELTDCVQKAENIWADHFDGIWNFVLEDAVELDFVPLRGINLDNLTSK
jgi:hypothetical protein